MNFMTAKITKKLSKKIDALTNQWSISMNADAVEEEVKKQLNIIRSKVNINGFRVGMAPIEEIDKRYGEDALYRAVNALIRDAINEIIKNEEYNLAMQPEVSFNGEIKRKEDISVGVKFVRKPEVPDINYKKIEIETVELELSEKDKEEELEHFRKQMANRKLFEGEKNVENGDMVDIDFVGKKAEDNVEFSGGSAKGYKLEIGSHSFIDGFEDQIVGHKKGETFDIKVSFPKDYHSQELKGKDAIFTITINDIYVKELPELDDEFAKKFGFESMEKIKNSLFENLKNVYENNAKNALKDEIFTAIFDKNKFALPESVIENEVDERLNDEKEHHKDDEKWDEKEERKKIKNDLYKSYAGFYLIDDIAKKNAIEVGEDEIKQFAKQDAIRNSLDVDDILKKIEKDDKMKSYISFTIKESKVFDFIFEKVTKKVKKMDKKSFEKYMDEKREKMSRK